MNVHIMLGYVVAFVVVLALFGLFGCAPLAPCDTIDADGRAVCRDAR